MADYLKPRVSTPKQIRDRRNGMFVNPPAYMENWGGATSSRMMQRTGAVSQMALEKGGPKARGRKPF